MASHLTTRTWTIRCKLNRTSIVLFAESTQPLRDLKAELFKALHQTCRDGTLHGRPLPTSPDDLLLAKPLDANDLTIGWIPLEPAPNPEYDDDDEMSAKRRGKAASTQAGKSKAGEALQSLGVKDNMVLAFKFRGVEEKRPRVEGGDFLISIDEEGEAWDVDAPTIESTYAEEDAVLPKDKGEEGPEVGMNGVK